MPAVVPSQTYGATWGDAMIKLIEFAQADPVKFLTVTLPLLAVGLLVAYFVYVVFIVGPVKKHKEAFDLEREKARDTAPGKKKG